MELPACPKCHRPRAVWPIKRPDLCSPVGWVYCIRVIGDDELTKPEDD